MCFLGRRQQTRPVPKYSALRHCSIDRRCQTRVSKHRRNCTHTPTHIYASYIRARKQPYLVERRRFVPSLLANTVRSGAFRSSLFYSAIKIITSFPPPLPEDVYSRGSFRPRETAARSLDDTRDTRPSGCVGILARGIRLRRPYWRRV